MNFRLAKLEVLIGTWHTTITMLDGDGSPNATSKATDIYRWSPSETFVLHDVDAEMNGERTRALEVIALDPGTEGYDVRAYEADGTFADYRAEMVESTWHITGEQLRFRGMFSNDSTELSGQWDKNVNGRWAAIMRVSLRKQASQ